MFNLEFVVVVFIFEAIVVDLIKLEEKLVLVDSFLDCYLGFGEME